MTAERLQEIEDNKPFRATRDFGAYGEMVDEIKRLRKLLLGAADMLTESAKQHRSWGDNGHAAMCDEHAKEARSAIHE